MRGPPPVIVLAPPHADAAAWADAWDPARSEAASALAHFLDAHVPHAWWQPTRRRLDIELDIPERDELQALLQASEHSVVAADARLAFLLPALTRGLDPILVSLFPPIDTYARALALKTGVPLAAAALAWEVHAELVRSEERRRALAPALEDGPRRWVEALRQLGAVLPRALASSPSPASTGDEASPPALGVSDFARGRALSIEDGFAEQLELRARVARLERARAEQRAQIFELKSALQKLQGSADLQLGRGLMETYRSLMPDRLRPWLGETAARLRRGRRSPQPSVGAPGGPGASGGAGPRRGTAPARCRLAPPIPDLERFDEAAIDVVVPIHNSLPDVRRCLAALARSRTSGTRVILVDDGSAEDTRTYLAEWSRRHEAELIVHEASRGFSNACNAGFERARAPVVVALNSDTVVPPGWLQRILRAFETDPKLGAAGPLSNAASWQSVPERSAATGGWAVNDLPKGLDVEDMQATVARLSAAAPVPVPILNGFCLALRRRMLDEIGPFDAVHFPRGYGEENDLCLRAGAKGWKLAVLTDVYVFHAKSKSFSSEGRRTLAAQGKETVIRIHGQEAIDRATDALKRSPELERMRARVRRFQARAEGATPTRIRFILPSSGGGGGAHSVVQETEGLRRLGVDAKLLVPARLAPSFEANYADDFDIEAVAEFHDEDQDLGRLAGVELLVATVFKSVKTLAAAIEGRPHILPAYYVQDYEPRFNPEGSDMYREALDSYEAVDGCLLFAKTRWLRDEVARLHGLAVHEVRPSLDHDVFHPRGRQPWAKPLRVTAMVRPSTPRRAPGRTLRVLAALAEAEPDLRRTVFGCSEEEIEAHGLELPPGVENRGPLRRGEVAALLRDTDVFVDLSDYQAFGRTGLEAMACGATAVLPAAGGARDYVDGGNGILVDTRDEAACLRAIQGLLADEAGLQARQEAALQTARRFTVDRAALSEALLFWAALASTDADAS